MRIAVIYISFNLKLKFNNFLSNYFMYNSNSAFSMSISCLTVIFPIDKFFEKDLRVIVLQHFLCFLDY